MQHGRVIDTWMVEGEGGGTDVGRERSMPGLAYFGGWAFLPLARRQFLSRPPHCPAIRPAILFARQNARDLRTVVQKYRSSPLREIENCYRERSIRFFLISYLSLSLAHYIINNKIVLTTRDSFLSSLRAEGLVGLVDSRDWFERIRVPVSYVYIHRVQWCCPMGDGEGGEEEEEKEGIEKKKKLWFESVEILISVVDETRDRGKRVTREGRGDAGFPPPSFPPPQRHRPSPCLGYKVVACLQAQSLCRWSTDPRKHLARPKNRPTTRVNDATPICISVYRTTATPSKQVYFFFIFFLYRRSFEFRFSIRR